MEILFSDKFVAILNQWRWYPVQKERMALFTLICQMRRLQARKFADSQPQAKSVVNHVSSRRMGRIENIKHVTLSLLRSVCGFGLFSHIYSYCYQGLIVRCSSKV